MLMFLYIFFFNLINRFSTNTKIFIRYLFNCGNKKLLWYFHNLRRNFWLRFSQAVATNVKEVGRNPKRVQREVRKQLSFSAVSVQTAAVSPLPVVPGSQSYVQFSTAPAVKVICV